MTGFAYEALPMRVVFGAGSIARLAEEVERLGVDRVLVLSTPGQRRLAESVSERLGAASAGVHAEARMHVPVDTARRARDVALARGAGACVAVGGGSTTGLGKAIALEHELPVIAVPTTYSGSEMTPVWGLTADGEKRTGRDPKVLPVSVVYDPELTLGLPVGTSVTSGFNAIAHAVEGLYAPDASPVVSLMAEEGLRALVDALPRVVTAPADVDARSGALYGAWLCGAVLGATTMSLHHKLCHVLGGTYGLPHAETHCVVLPYALAYNAPAAPSAVQAIARATGSDDVATFLRDRALQLGAPASLRDLGLPEDAVDDVVRRVAERPYANPRTVTPEGVAAVVRAALTGAPVSSVD